MTTRTAAQEHNCGSDILGRSQSLVRAGLGQLLHSTAQLHQSVRHLGWEETWSDVVDKNALWAELEGEVAAEMERSGL
jgi:hypothetical protein